MKKLIIVISAALVLGACSQSAGDKFVGTWSGEAQCKYEKVVISKNNGGDNFTVEHLTDTESKVYGSGRMAYEVKARHDKENFNANLDGDTLIIKGQNDLPVKIQNNSIQIMNCTYRKNSN